MKGRWYTNWLLIITFCLLFSSVGVFVISLKDTIGLTPCIYGDDLEGNCICNYDGEKIFDENVLESVGTGEFVSSGLIYTFEYLHFVEPNMLNIPNIKFVDITYLGGGLKVNLEIISMCDEYRVPAPQVGFYKYEENRLTLTIGTNLTDEYYRFPCVTDSTFYIGNFSKNLNNDFKVVYQDEYDVIYQSENCVFEGYLRSNGDVYNSEDGCFLCQCIAGENVCEKEKACLE